MEFIKNEAGFAVSENNIKLLESQNDRPMIFVGRGEESVDMHRGYFTIEDYIVKKNPLEITGIDESDDGYIINFSDILIVNMVVSGHKLKLQFSCFDKSINRIWIRIPADADEKCYGCGEQFSYFNLRGRKFPLWTSEPGIGRNKNTYLTWLCDMTDQTGGDYYNTNFPEATYISSKKYYLHADSFAYAEFDFRNKDFHELQFFGIPSSLTIETAESFIELTEKLTNLLGRHRELPDWIYDGAIIGLQGGTARLKKLTEASLSAGIKVCGVWCQDWSGKKVTSFGKRVQWDWSLSEKRYPGLSELISDLKEQGIRFLSYINPYLADDGDQYKEGAEKGYLVKDKNGAVYKVDFGEFNGGIVDLTNPEAYSWFKGIIEKNLIEAGHSGWMADFGEYLPADCILYNGEPADLEHNRYPLLWAMCNDDALKETGTSDDIVYFMRSGAAGTQKLCPLLWAGDQSVDFSIHDGLISAVCAALSSGICGCGVTHSDIGGYTSVHNNSRTQELFLRWADMNVFTPVMRTHESNRPDENFQYYDDDDAMAVFAEQTKIHIMLKPYLKKLVKEYSEKGTPVQRPLFMHYEDDSVCYDIQTSYLLGADMLVAPVYLEGQTERKLYLPDDEWIYLWNGKEYGKGYVTVNAPIGRAPVFYRKGSEDAEFFEKIGKTFGSAE